LKTAEMFLQCFSKVVAKCWPRIFIDANKAWTDASSTWRLLLS